MFWRNDMSMDPMADAIAKKQVKAWRSLYSPADLERDENYRKIYQERKDFKILMLAVLKEDEEFRKQVRELLNQE